MTPLRGLNEDFRALLACLNAEGVRYLVVGAYALAFHGVPRATGDIDVLVEPTPANAQRVWAALSRFGVPLDPARLSVGDLSSPGVVYQIGIPPRRIDLLTHISGLDFEQAWSTRVETDLDGAIVPLLGRDALVANKRASGRLKDLADVERLERPDAP